MARTTPALKQIFIVPKVFEPLNFDCIHLQPRPTRPSQPSAKGSADYSGKGGNPMAGASATTQTLDGRTICRLLFQSRLPLQGVSLCAPMFECRLSPISLHKLIIIKKKKKKKKKKIVDESGTCSTCGLRFAVWEEELIAW